MFLTLDELRQDVRYGLRTLVKHPGFTSVAVLTLALGIGANTAIFSVVDAVLLKPLPYPSSHQLVRTIEHVPGSLMLDGMPGRLLSMNVNDILEWQSQTDTLSHLAAYDSRVVMSLTSRDGPIRVVGSPVTPSMFPTLDVQPVRGRAFSEREGRPDAPRTVIVTHGMWQNVFGADPNILDRILTLDGDGYSVIGVMPRGFEFPERETAFWLPLELRATGPERVTSYQTIGRLREGVGVETATAEANVILQGVRGWLQGFDPAVTSQNSFDVVRVKDELVAPVRDALLVLMAGVGLVLLIACSNVASLLLARGTARQGEAAIRIALGAGRGRLIRQLLTESLLLALMGGVAGCAVAFGGVHLLARFGPADVPRLDDVAVDGTALAFTLCLSMLTGVLFGVGPSLQMARVNPMERIKAITRTGASDRGRTRNVIVIMEFGMAVVLLIGGGLLIHSFLKLSNVDPGFDAENLLAFQVALPRTGNANRPSEAVNQEFRVRLESLPGVRSVALAYALPLRPRGGSFPRIQGVPGPMEGVPEVSFVSRSYFSTMGVRLLEGRTFGDDDGLSHPRVVVINQTMASHFGGENPIGNSITVAGEPAEIVGIVQDTQERGLDVAPRPQVYIDSRRGFGRRNEANAMDWAYFVLRTHGEPTLMIPHVRSLVRQLVSDATLELNVGSMDDIISSSVAQPRFYAVLLGIFAIVAATLASIGVYGVTAYSVAQRTHEMGIRMALGAQRSDVMVLVFGQVLKLTVVGLVIGLAGAAAVTRFLESLLFGVTATDAVAFVAAPLLLIVVVGLACYLPARRAASVDPMTVLRTE